MQEPRHRVGPVSDGNPEPRVVVGDMTTVRGACSQGWGWGGIYGIMGGAGWFGGDGVETRRLRIKGRLQASVANWVLSKSI